MEIGVPSQAKNGYKQIERLTDKVGSPMLVRNIETQEFWVQKEYPFILKESLVSLQQIKHSNLPKIDKIVEEDGKIYLYEEYIHGKTLSELIYSSDSMTGREVMEISLAILNGLTELHKQGLIHRDIKPSNVMISNDQIIKLIDFDAVRRISGNKETDTVQLGTVGFAAPEQFGFAETDARSDIYSLGVLMNVCLVRDYPRNKLPEDLFLRKIISRAVKMDPKDRYQNVVEMREAILFELKKEREVYTKEKNEQNKLSEAAFVSEAKLSPESEMQNTSKIRLQKISFKNDNSDFSYKKEKVVKKHDNSFFKKYIPGFRTGKRWKRNIAIIAYVVLFIGIVENIVKIESLSGKIYWLSEFFFYFFICQIKLDTISSSI
ncbi:serine/threonine protein kinase [Enterococcus sp. CWB-B31]|uniref:serine/threonine protein kinase n=1 Tax=Enterococcus sp. CWB-B31 TaxID=2885159 RepID=UPI001E424A2C|nr:serine/threonine-protein kinase [Enterococcus sp. CWB-B31]MCB5955847.1 serine/threonine protein kinase [Enterococcus sp. CWB-B31]